jgi:hypothetical protein
MRQADGGLRLPGPFLNQRQFQFRKPFQSVQELFRELKRRVLLLADDDGVNTSDEAAVDSAVLSMVLPDAVSVSEA